MEVDLPQIIPKNFAFGTTNGDAPSTSPVGATVQFNAFTEVKTFAKPATTIAEDQHHPKHKARRRARPPKIDMIDTNGSISNGESPTQVAKPLSPSKLKKLAEKDRHSRSGRRGMPKKGEFRFICVYVYVFGMCEGGLFVDMNFELQLWPGFKLQAPPVPISVSFGTQERHLTVACH